LTLLLLLPPSMPLLLPLHMPLPLPLPLPLPSLELFLLVACWSAIPRRATSSLGSLSSFAGTASRCPCSW
jgi:hypothetical protein